jgi:hypothetical protein
VSGRPVPADPRRRRELVARLRSVAPVWLLLDDAAAVGAQFAEAARFAEGRRDTGPPAWLLAPLVDAVEGFVAGTANTCLHNPTPDVPQALFGATWRPSLIVCGECVWRLMVRPVSPAARQCAACGRVSGPSETVFAGMTRCGMLLFRSVCCSDCAPPGM